MCLIPEAQIKPEQKLRMTLWSAAAEVWGKQLPRWKRCLHSSNTSYRHHSLKVGEPVQLFCATVRQSWVQKWRTFRNSDII